MEREIVIDSSLPEREATLDAPHATAPVDIRETLIVSVVQYVSYDTKVHEGQIVMHKERMQDVLDFFAYAHELRFPIAKVIPIAHPEYAWDDERSCRDNNSSGYNYRTVLGTDRLSKHAYGCAFDINPRENIYIRYDTEGQKVYRLPQNGSYDPQAPGTLSSTHPLVELMRSREWVWGGDWTKEHDYVIDYQHFEKPL